VSASSSDVPSQSPSYKGYWVIVQHISDHAEGSAYTDLASAQTAYAAAGTNYLKRIYDPSLKVLEQFGCPFFTSAFCQMDAFAAQAQATGVAPTQEANTPACCFTAPSTWPCS
jgi:hypothetical protein